METSYNQSYVTMLQLDAALIIIFIICALEGVKTMAVQITCLMVFLFLKGSEMLNF